MFWTLAGCEVQEPVEEVACPTAEAITAHRAESDRLFTERRDAALAAAGLVLLDADGALGAPRWREPGPWGPRAEVSDLPAREFGLRGAGADHVLVGPAVRVPCGGGGDPAYSLARAADGAIVPVWWKYEAALPTLWACGCPHDAGCGSAPRNLRPEWPAPADAVLGAPVVLAVPDRSRVVRLWSQTECEVAPSP